MSMYPGSPWSLLRTVILDSFAQQFVDRTDANQYRFSDQWDGLVWLLSKTPEIGKPKSGSKPNEHLLLHVLPSEMAGTKSLAVLYSFDDECVTIHAADFVDNL